MRKAAVILIILVTGLTKIQGQTLEDMYNWASEIVESMAGESEDQDYSYLIEDLVKIYQNPIDINKASRQDIEPIIFLNGIQIENLLYHRHNNGPFFSILDLQVIEGFNRQILEWLEPLIYFSAPQPRKKSFRPRGDLFVRTRFTVETPAGYTPSGDKPRAFLGDKYLLYSRFETSLAPGLEAGLITEKDQGEDIFNSQVSTMDFISGYISWKPDKFLRQIIIGQYRISGGQGLALQTGMGTMKSSLTTTIRNRTNGFRPSLSANEYSGLSGVLMSFGNHNFSISPFFSSRYRDGHLSTDENGNTFITSLKTDGYHRTASELAARKTTREDVYGVQMKYFFNKLTVEAGHLEYNLEFPLVPSVKPYSQYYFSGNHNRNSWLAVEGGIGNAYLFSEMAFNNSFDPAIWSGVLFSPGGNVAMAMSYRRIPVEYIAPLGVPFSESSSGSGESGFYAGMQIDLPAKLILNAYIDYFKFNWLRYRLDAPSDGYDFLTNLTYKPGRRWENSLRYRHREKMVNVARSGADFPVGVRTQNQVRFQTRFNPDKVWSFTTRIDYHKVTIPGENIPSGFFLGQEIKYSHPGDKWNLITRYGIIDVEDYETRIYVYEPDVLYSFTTPAYYGVGSRWILMGKWTIIKNLDLWARYSWWHYSNREEISSGNTLIDSNEVREVRLQIRKKF